MKSHKWVLLHLNLDPLHEDQNDDADDDDEYHDDCGVRLRPNHISGSQLDPLHLEQIENIKGVPCCTSYHFKGVNDER